MSKWLGLALMLIVVNHVFCELDPSLYGIFDDFDDDDNQTYHIYSPNYPHEYDNKILKQWNITSAPDQLIVLYFRDFYTENLHDRLTIYDGDSNSSRYITSYSGRFIPPPLISLTNKLFLQFKTDSGVVGKGFKISYRYIETDTSIKCGGNYTGSQSDIMYEKAENHKFIWCYWNITVAVNQSIQLNFEELDLKNTTLTIYEGSVEFYEFVQLSALNGSSTKRNVVSSTNNLILKLGSISGAKFKLHYKSIKYGCGKNFTVGPSGTIYSPGYPDNYFPDITCQWKIMIPMYRQIYLKFAEFQTEDQDVLEVFDSYSALGINLPLYNFSGNIDNYTNISSKSYVMFLKFTSDGQNTGKGFKIDYLTRDLSMDYPVLISTNNSIIHNVSNHLFENLIPNNVHHYEIIDYYYGLMFLFQKDTNEIKLTDNELNVYRVFSNQRFDSIATDWIHDLIYWIDSQSKSIKVLNTQDFNNTVYTITKLREDNPRDLVINLQKSKLIWSSVGFDPKIMECNSDGTNQTILYRRPKQAFHLTVDYQSQTYYFVDIIDYSLYSIDFNGNNEKYFFTSHLLFHSINNMIVLTNDLYLSNESMIYRIPELDLNLPIAQVLYTTQKYYSLKRTYSYDGIKYFGNVLKTDSIYDFKIISSELRPNISNRCQSVDCSQICLPIHESYRCHSSSDEFIDENFDQNFVQMDNNRERSVDSISIVNLIFNILIILAIITLGLLIFRSKIDLLRKKTLSIPPLNPRLSMQDMDNNENNSDVNYDRLKSYQNLLQNEDK